uniref:Uncharacterized protein n=1 Tax=Cacopsylla melanoneura TaxID=428564 RepID=A0A8D8PV90_9HEMI
MFQRNSWISELYNKKYSINIKSWFLKVCKGFGLVPHCRIVLLLLFKCQNVLSIRMYCKINHQIIVGSRYLLYNFLLIKYCFPTIFNLELDIFNFVLNIF